MALGMTPVFDKTAHIKITQIGVPTVFPHENRVSHCPKKTATQSVPAIKRGSWMMDIGEIKQFYSSSDFLEIKVVTLLEIEGFATTNLIFMKSPFWKGPVVDVSQKCPT